MKAEYLYPDEVKIIEGIQDIFKSVERLPGKIISSLVPELVRIKKEADENNKPEISGGECLRLFESGKGLSNVCKDKLLRMLKDINYALGPEKKHSYQQKIQKSKQKNKNEIKNINDISWNTNWADVHRLARRLNPRYRWY